MNIIDLLVLIVLGFAAWRGWQQGFVVQLCSLAGLFIAVWLAAQLGTEAGRLCGFDAEVAGPAGFLIVLVLALLAAAIVGRALRKMLKFAGLGFIDTLLGIAVALVKYALLLSLLIAAFDRLNEEMQLVAPYRLASSKSYRPLQELSGRIFPYVDQLRSEVSEQLSRTSGEAAE